MILHKILHNSLKRRYGHNATHFYWSIHLMCEVASLKVELVVYKEGKGIHYLVVGLS